eukprot:scaffold600_cov150-Skeletonema_menzelii.AAC.1
MLNLGLGNVDTDTYNMVCTVGGKGKVEGLPKRNCSLSRERAPTPTKFYLCTLSTLHSSHTQLASAKRSAPSKPSHSRSDIASASAALIYNYTTSSSSKYYKSSTGRFISDHIIIMGRKKRPAAAAFNGAAPPQPPPPAAYMPPPAAFDQY